MIGFYQHSGKVSEQQSEKSELLFLREKLECPKSLVQDGYHIKYGRQIVARYREEALSKFGQEFFSPENSFGAPVPVPGRQAEMASWWEFVQWIITTLGRTRGNSDVHWRPYRLESFSGYIDGFNQTLSIVTFVRYVLSLTTMSCILKTLMKKKISSRRLLMKNIF